MVSTRLLQILLRRWPRSVAVLMDNDMFLSDFFSVRRYLRRYAMAGIVRDVPYPCVPHAPPFLESMHTTAGPPCAARSDHLRSDARR